MKLILPFVTPELLINDELAIVGSSGRLTNSPVGRSVDSFKEVVRFNRAPTHGYETIAGSKTTLRITNNHVFDNLDISDRGFSHQPADFVSQLRNETILYYGPVLGPWDRRETNAHSSNKLHMFMYEDISVFKRRLGVKFEDLMTGGGVAIGLCVLAGIRPTLFGFDLEPGPRTHYWETRPTDAGRYHNVSEEQLWILDLESKSKITIK